MQKKQEDEDFMICTAPALAQRFKLPPSFIPQSLHHALKSIRCPQENSISSSVLCNSYMKCIKSLSDVQRITERDYLFILKICLYLIQFELDVEMKQYTLKNHTIKISDSEKNCFLISMKTLSFDCPVVIRPEDSAILFESSTKRSFYTKVVNVEENNDIIIRPFPQDVKTLQESCKEKQFNISFRSQHWPLRCCHYALTIMSQRNWMEIIYPQLKTNCIDMEFDIEWVNTNIKENKRQRQAVKKILNNTARPAPYIIFGPPGTGKTATLVETICQIVRHYPSKNILVCTVSNAAADEIAKRLIKQQIPKNLIYRMYAPSREWSTVNEDIQPCANFVEKTTLFLSKDLLLLKKIIITTLVSSIRLSGVSFWENHFSYIIVDEASQATEAEMLIPLAITNKAEDGTEFQAQIIIAGDPYQLGPVIRCRRIEHLLGRSTLERLMDDSDVYKKQNGKYNRNYITKLVKNYRSHESLLYVSNKQFYNNELEICGGANTQMALDWSQLPNKKFPMIFQEVIGTEERSPSQSVYNTAEVLAVLVYVNILMNTKFNKRAIKTRDIGIITPFKRQQLDIKHHLAAMNLKGITVGTVETFQGQERNVMILSTVRSKIFKHDDIEHLGFLSNPKRFNVALTRAKALMIIIGDPSILCTNKHWKVLWEYCKKNGGYVPFEQLPLKEDLIIKLKGISEANSSNSSIDSDTSSATNLPTMELRKEEREARRALSGALVSEMESLILKKKTN
ncbi:PREDICTED: putative helicase MOV-10 [Wasmannia auropunctata]|uniref:putative helicase MOV-10 n=1 Tax=Wasmannia auropunctata TaxID=64793 RepID=UPI0005F0B431|nr:PREDICTED: putative helicase MOV-10 [Wasmannia auropunctata]